MTERVADFISVYIDAIDKEDWNALFNGMFEEAVLRDYQCTEVIDALKEIGVDLEYERGEYLYNFILKKYGYAGGINLSSVVFGPERKFPFSNTLGMTLRQFMNVLRAHGEKISYKGENKNVIWEFKK